jgi:hypothetical protein
MQTLSKLEVSGLFGHLAHEVVFESQLPTLLAGPNGTGKTHILLLIKAALQFDVTELLRLPYERIVLTFSNGLGFQVRRIADGLEGSLEIACKLNGRTKGKPTSISGAQVQADQEAVPERFRRLRSGRWHDRATDRMYTDEGLRREFGFGASRDVAHYLKDQPDLLALSKTLHPILIDTKRLDREALDPRVSEPRLGMRPENAGGGIAQYVDDIRVQITEARRASVQATQSADLSFAARALEAAGLAVKEQRLHERYDAVVNQYEELARNGLATGEAPLGFPPKTTPTVRRILSVFLDDWEKRLEPLQPVSRKLQTLRQILDTKLSLSGKKTSIDERGVLRFRTLDGRRIAVSRLSSGEQHLVALFTRLTFSTRPGSIVLIDEPEISMHAAWKHSFLDDIEAVAKLAEFQVVAATHSTAIINGRWDLVQELSFSSSTLDTTETTAGDEEEEEEE